VLSRFNGVAELGGYQQASAAEADHWSILLGFEIHFRNDLNHTVVQPFRWKRIAMADRGGG
jgi:hypothetical protein